MRKRSGLSRFTQVLLLATVYAAAVTSTRAQRGEPKVRNVLLVHGAFANSSSWAKVIPRLQANGFHVTAVELPLTSLKDDVAAVTRALNLADGPVVLVGHSYGGAVITEAGNDPKVKSLVYVAAFAPDLGESAMDLSKSVPPVPLGTEFRPDAADFLKLTRKGIFEDFAQDLSAKERELLVATQAPISVNALKGSVTVPAWKNKPSSYVIATNDRAVSAELERQTAVRIKAKITSVASSHVVMLSHPDEVAKVIMRAARASADN